MLIRLGILCQSESEFSALQSLLVTCRLYEIDPYDYLVDVLQRVGRHPASRMHELTPRLWTQFFAANSLRQPA